jgi:hypothetical protein
MFETNGQPQILPCSKKFRAFWGGGGLNGKIVLLGSSEKGGWYGTRKNWGWENAKNNSEQGKVEDRVNDQERKCLEWLESLGLRLRAREDQSRRTGYEINHGGQISG